MTEKISKPSENTKLRQDSLDAGGSLEQAVLSAPALLYLCEPQAPFALRFVSANLAAITGWTVAEWMNTSEFRFEKLHPQDRAAYRAALAGVADQASVSLDYRLAIAGGGYRWFRDRLTWTDDELGPRQIAGCMIDVSVQRQREETRRLSREQLEDAIESLSEGVVIYDAEDRLVLCNRQYKVFHQGSEDLFVPGAHWRDITRQRAERGLFVEAQGRIEDWLEGQMAQRGIAKNEVFPFAGGRWFEYSHRPIRRGGFVSTWRDITERRAAETKLGEQRELLHQSEKLSALGEILAGVAHELNNPLSVVVGQSMILQEAIGDPDVRQRAEKIGSAANRCARIVKNFLALARQDALDSRPLELKPILESALEVTAYSLKAWDIRADLQIEDPGLQVIADPDQLRQVFVNLIVNAQNALKEIDQPRQLLLSACAKPGEPSVVITIADNGPGIPKAEQRRIFEPLFTTKAKGEGTGMGLAICHRIISALDGSISLESDSGKGACFTITLPTTMPEIEDQASAVEPPSELAGLRVLVVDDDLFVGEIISEILEYDSHHVEVAHSGKEALEKLETGTFDVILSDMRMPEMDGPQFYRLLAARWPERVECLAFITGDTFGPGVKSFLDSTQRPYLEKPITPEDVVSLIERIVQGKRS